MFFKKKRKIDKDGLPKPQTPKEMKLYWNIKILKQIKKELDLLKYYMKKKTWEEEFDEEFTEIKFGDGTVTGGGKGTYRVVKENISLDDIKQFISNLLKQQKEDFREIVGEAEWNFDNKCDCNMCFINKKTVKEILSKLDEM